MRGHARDKMHVAIKRRNMNCVIDEIHVAVRQDKNDEK